MKTKKICILHYPLNRYRIDLFLSIQQKAEKNNIELSIICGRRNNQNYGAKEEYYRHLGDTLTSASANNMIIDKTLVSHIKTMCHQDADIFVFGNRDSIQDIIFTCLGIIILKIRKKKIIIFNGVRRRLKGKRNWRVRLVDTFMSLWSDLPDGYISHSLKSTTYLKEILQTKKPIYQTCNYSKLKVEPTAYKIEKNYYKKVSEIIILFVGRAQQREKGLEVLLDAFKGLKEKYKHITLFVVGSKKTIVDQKNSIYYFSHVKHSEIAGFYRIADICVMPSLRQDAGCGEPRGLVVNEAMQMGRPVVVSDSSGCIPELFLTHNKDMVFKTGSRTDLYKVLENLLINKETIRQLGKRNRELHNDILDGNIIDAWIQYIKKI